MTTPATTPFPTFVPALNPPPGIVSNPNHPASLARVATVTTATCVPAITLLFAVRNYVRFWIKRVFIFEDVLCIVLWCGTVAFCGMMRTLMSHGGGKHMWDISPATSHESAYWFNMCTIVYGTMIAVAKIAVLSLYRRIFSPLRRSVFDIFIVGLSIVVFLFYSTTTMVKIFECWPRNKIWNRSIPGQCVVDMNWVLNMSGIFNTISDWIILLLPIHAVSRLQMDKVKKVLVVLAFTSGMCAPIFATIGLTVRIRNSGNKDTSWKQPEILLWAACELASGNLILCFPELAVLFRKEARRRKSFARPPGVSTIRGWSEARSSKRAASDPYMTRSLVHANSNGRNAHYIELDEGANKVSISGPRGTPDQQENGDRVVVRKDIVVETHSIV